MIQVLKDISFLKEIHKLGLITVSLPNLENRAFQSACTLTKMNEWTEKCVYPCIKGRFKILNLAPATSSGSLEGGFAIVNLSSYKKKKQNSCFPMVQE